MMERPATSKSSATEPPAANQPVGDDEATPPSQSRKPPGSGVPVDPAPEVVRGKPDGEVDTRP